MIPLDNPTQSTPLTRLLARVPRVRRVLVPAVEPLVVGRVSPAPPGVAPPRRVVRRATAEPYAHAVSKRSLDVVLAAVAIAATAPLLLLTAALIRIDSSGPVLFQQERVGSRRRRSSTGAVEWEIRHFNVYKFRTMFHGASDSLHRAVTEAFVRDSTDPDDLKLTADPRVTRLGRLLRRTSIDELPQLLNVLRGDMSLVGPRPVPVYEAAAYVDAHWERLAALPGITGLWQVEGRGRGTFSEMIRMDIEYARRQSLWLDLKILCATIPAVMSRRGAE